MGTTCSCNASPSVGSVKIHTLDTVDFIDGSASRSVTVGTWKYKQTAEDARQMYEAEGTIPPGCTNQLLELRTHLAEPLLLKHFGIFARKQEMLSALMCWAEILEFKDIDVKQNDYQFSKALHIFQTYIKTDAPSFVTVNISAEWRDKLAMVLATSQGGMDSHLFDEYHQEVLSLIYRILFVPYKKTSAYRQSVSEMRKAYNHVSVDDFEYKSLLGVGGFGCVVLCKKKSTGMHYAMKIQTKVGLLSNFGGDSARAMSEKNALVSCHHPFIVSMDYAFQTPSMAIMVMNLGTAGTLNDSLSHCPNRCMPDERVRFYMAEIALALAHLHRMGLIYRDLKPANVLLYRDGHIKLADFGGVVDVGGKVFGYLENGGIDRSDSSAAAEAVLFQPGAPRDVSEISASIKNAFSTASDSKEKYASKSARVKATMRKEKSFQEDQPSHSESYKSAGPPSLRKAKSIMGTGGFMAPEMLAMLFAETTSSGAKQTRKGYTSMVDYWSFGIMIFKLLTGNMLFHSTHIGSFVEHVSLPAEEQAKIAPEYQVEYAQFLDKIFADHPVISKPAADLMTQLLQIDYRRRLVHGTDGVKQLKSHQYFQGIEWDLLAQQLVVPPFKLSEDELADDGTSEGPAFETFDDMIFAYRKPGWNMDEPSEEQQHVFGRWDFVSPSILKVELGIAADILLTAKKHPFLRAVENTLGSVTRMKPQSSPHGSAGNDRSLSVSRTKSSRSDAAYEVLSGIERDIH